MNDLDNFCSLRTLNDLIDFFDHRAYKHGKKYFHYTSVWAANKILTEGLLFFRRVVLMTKQITTTRIMNFAFA